MYIIAYTTTADFKEAKRIASHLVDNKLAACVNIHPISSVYRWNGKVEDDEEFAVSIKTVSKHFDTICEVIRSMHSYELPAIISWEIDGDKDYLDWILESTTNK
jgi:periplasmic divalent cation tolerance protein